MLDLVLIAFIGFIAALGLKRPFLWVLLYIYVDIVIPQKIGWGFINALPLSMMVFKVSPGPYRVNAPALPASTLRMLPVLLAALSLARKYTASAISSGSTLSFSMLRWR